MSKSQTDNKLILKRRKKMKVKKYIAIFVILISVSVTLCLKLSYFDIKEIEVVNNRNIKAEDIKKLSQINLNDNIFYLNLKKSKDNILSNSYITNVNITRKLPSKINIEIEERKAVFYVLQDDKYLVIDKNGIVLEEKDNINGMKLLKLQGFNNKNYELGKVLNASDERKIKIINQITELVEGLKTGVPEPSMVDISDITDIKLYYKEMVVKVGTENELKVKINRAINVLVGNNLTNSKGYIDVSFKGSPVFSVQN